ncbi:L,D-transpeptidase family protein [Nonomuraea sp. CA-218870]|uniref:L,D-transpeptidase family protein n=1 Tax=Nonomuraea sp. CA-218870 TaxID=3239998 RepID=UPI003D8E6176
MINACRIVLLVLCLAIPPALPLAAAAAPYDEEFVLRPGDRGEEVRHLQRLLRQRGYLPRKANGVFDQETRYAVWAFRKSRGLRVGNVVDTPVWRRLDRYRPVRPLVRNGAPNRVEIDLRRQLLVVYRARRPVLISHASTGAGVRFCQGGRCRIATTPIGDFRVFRRAPGWTKGPLGSMYNSLYFVGGVAMHGSRGVPSWPGSHGCVRLPMAVSERLFRMVGIGEPVHVRRSRR